MRQITAFAAASCLIACSTARAQFDPAIGQWGKTDSRHVRVMTWNIEDGITSTNFKTNGANNWNALVRIVAALKPDVLILQEVGDNSGNGTGSGVDSVVNLETTLRLFFTGGADPFRGGNVTSYVQLFSDDPAYDLPHVFVSGASDGFNRNVIVSRWPFADINGDGVSLRSDIFINDPPFSGNGGIRGFQFAEIDLPDDAFGGDLVIGNGHLKSGGGSSNENQRVTAGKNVGAFIQSHYNGGGDPLSPTTLSPLTPVIVGGDWNQDENASLSNPSNVKGPARWITEGTLVGPDDGRDRDGSDMTRDNAPRKVITFTGAVADGSTLTNSAGKIDFLAHQDSVVSVANQFIFDSFELSVFPPAVASYPGNVFFTSRDAADHWPVTVDYIFPEPVAGVPADLNGDGAVDGTDLLIMLNQFGGPGSADINNDGVVDGTDLLILLNAFGT